MKKDIIYNKVHSPYLCWRLPCYKCPFTIFKIDEDNNKKYIEYCALERAEIRNDFPITIKIIDSLILIKGAQKND